MGYPLKLPENHYIKNKKVRGSKRHLQQLRKRLEEHSKIFPSEDYVHDGIGCGYYHYHLPCSGDLVDSTKSSHKLRRMVIKELIDSGLRLIENRPKTHADKQVVISISLPHIWDSQITIFYSPAYFNNFFDRNSPEQKWTPIKDSAHFIKSYNIQIPEKMKIQGYIEEIKDEDENSTGEVWFIGEL